MKHSFIVAAIFVVLLWGAYTPAYAKTRGFFTHTLTVSEEFTDNLFLTHKEKESEFITAVSPGAELNVEGKSFGWELNYAPSFIYYDELDELNTIRHRASLTGNYQLAEHLTLTLADHFMRTEETYRRPVLTLRDPESEEQPLEERIDYTIRTTREPRYTNDALAKLDYQFGADDHVYVGFKNRVFRDERPQGEDSESYTPNMGFEYWMGTKNGVRGDLSYTRGLFEEERNDFHNGKGSLRYTHKFDRFLGVFAEYTHLAMDFEHRPTDNYQVYNPALGLNYAFAQDANLEISLGYFVQDRKRRDNESGFTVNLDIDKDWSNKRWAFRLSGSSGYEQTYFGTENLGFTEYYQARGALDYYLTRYLRSSFDADYRFNRYLDVDPERKDHIASASGGLTYQATEWMSFSLKDTYRIVDSENELNDYQENSVMLSVSILSGPYRLW